MVGELACCENASRCSLAIAMLIFFNRRRTMQRSTTVGIWILVNILNLADNRWNRQNGTIDRERIVDALTKCADSSCPDILLAGGIFPVFIRLRVFNWAIWRVVTYREAVKLTFSGQLKPSDPVAENWLNDTLNKLWNSFCFTKHERRAVVWRWHGFDGQDLVIAKMTRWHCPEMIS